MPQIDFYILKATDTQARLQFTARLCEKAVGKGMTVHILTDGASSNEQVSEALWAFRPDAFVAHTYTQQPNTAVWIGKLSDPPALPPTSTLLINLATEISPEYNQYARLAEIVIQEQSVLNTTRKHYSHYKSRGVLPTSHTIP